MTSTGRAPLGKTASSKHAHSGPPPAEAPIPAKLGNPKPSAIRRWFRIWEQFIGGADLDFEEVHKRKLFVILILPGIGILFSFAGDHLSHANLLEGLFDLMAGMWLVLTLVAFRLVRNGVKIYRINAALIGCLFLFLSIKGGVQGTKLVWPFSFPLIAFYTLGRREGLISTLLLYSLLISILYLPWNFLQVYAYTPEFKLRFCIAFFLVGSLTYIYESVRAQFQTNLKGERNKLEAETAKLAELSTALQQTNQALTLSEERLTRAQAIACVGNLEYRIFSGTVWGSAEALRILGISGMGPEFPLSVLERIVPELDHCRSTFETCMRQDREYDQELTIHRLSDGRVVCPARQSRNHSQHRRKGPNHHRRHPGHLRTKESRTGQAAVGEETDPFPEDGGPGPAGRRGGP